MDNPDPRIANDPRIIYIDRLYNGIVVGFDDGKEAFYSAALLHATLAQAQILPAFSPDEGQDDGLAQSS